MEEAPSAGREAPGARRCARRPDARPLHRLVSGTRQSAARAAQAAAGSGAFGSGRENLVELVGLGDFELVVAAILGPLVGSPTQEDRRMAEAIALQVVVLHLAHAFRAQRLPREIFARAPAALRARHAARFRRGAGPFAPRVIPHRVVP